MSQSTVGAFVWNWLAVREVDLLVDNGGMARIDILICNGASTDMVGKVHTNMHTLGLSRQKNISLAELVSDGTTGGDGCLDHGCLVVATGGVVKDMDGVVKEKAEW